MTPGRQADISAYTPRPLEARRIVDCRLEAKSRDWTDTRHGHEPADLWIMTGQLQNLTVEVVDLLLDRLTRLEQRCDYSNQFGTILNQFLRSSREDIELGTANNEAEILEQATDLVLEIALDLDQQCSAHQQRFHQMAVD